jgi:class 3 adenylate cyclase/tetratricopeptide (TPR) repeat protein
MSNRHPLEQAIAIQESLRGTIDDAIIDATIAALRAQLASLEPHAPAESRRAQATILFIDLAGHTELIQGRDPEEIMEILDRALERLAEPVARHGGRIVRFQGDGYKAAFGLPTAQEHDPDNAVLAGLAILETAAAIADELETERGLPGFKVRVGIDTGLVLMGGGTEGEDAVTGLPVNLAARLESLAEPGTVLISHHTYQHVRGVFDFQPLPAVQARGFADPVPVYRVVRRKTRSFRTRRRGVEGVETQMVGRVAELAALQVMYGRMVERRECLSAVIVGDAGLGKSRLLYEFENWADLQPADVHLYRGRARLETQGLPYGLLRDVFAFRYGIHDDDTLAAVRQKIVDGFHAVLGQGDDVEMKAHLVGHLLGYDFTHSPHLRPLLGDARQLRAQALFYLTEYFRATAENFPILFLLEDLHWADDSSLDAIAALGLAFRAHPVMILGAARPTLYERRPRWMAEHPAHTRLDLSLLDSQDSAHLVAEILQRVESVPQRLRELIIERAEGNPFYVEELIKMLIEDGVIVKGEDRWGVVDEKLAGLEVPPTLTGILQARLDALPAIERDALQVASVIGRLFWDAAVEIICRQHGNQIDESLWPALRQREIVYLREGTAFEGTTEYVFKHALLRDVTYESVLRRLRREYHRHAAEWLIKVGGDRVDEFADQIANHFATAGATREEAEWQARAGRQAARQYAAPEAIRALSRALELAPPEDLAAQFELLTQRWKVYHLLGDRAAEAADLARQAQLAEIMKDDHCLAQVAVDQARFQLVIGAYEEALTLSARAQTLTEATSDGALKARAMASRGNSLMFLGEYDEARAALEGALELARSAGADSVLMDITRILGVVAEEQGDFDAQRRFYEESLRLARELGDRVGVRRALNSLGIVALNRGAHAEARDYYEQSLAIARAIGDRMGEGTVLGNLGVRASILGEYQQARQLFEDALTIAREANDRTGVNVNVLNLAGIFAHLGETDTAVARYDEALGGARETGDRPLIGYILNGKGRALLEGGRLAEAVEVLRSALDLRLELGQNHLAAETRAYLSEALAVAGDLAAALVEGESALSFMEDGRLEDAEDESRVFLSLYRLLRTAGDERAGALLERAYTRLQAAAAVLDAPSRQAYLDNVPWNRAILTLWEERGD